MAKGITSLTGFVKKLETLQDELNGTFYFRGHSDRSYDILPSVLRDENLKKNESLILELFEAEIPELFEGVSGTFDALVQAQHFGLPTRLLDVTSNPLMALFFACWGADNYDTTGEVLVFEVERNSEKFTRSDTVACVANLARMSQEERDDISSVVADTATMVGSYDASDEKWKTGIEHFNRDATVRRLVQFVRDEKPYFENRIRFDDLFDIATVIPSKRNARISAQSGAFLLFGLSDEFSSTWANNINVHRVHVNADSKEVILKALDAVGINENTAFPEPEKVASSITRKFKS